MPLSSSSATLSWIKENLVVKDCVIVSPMASAVAAATSIADDLDTDLGLIHKEWSSRDEVVRYVVIGDIKDRVAVNMDDTTDVCD